MLARTSACRRVASTQLRARRRAHSHTHEHLDSPGDFNKRETGLPAHWRGRDWRRRAFTVGIGGPVGSGKTALTLQLCRALREKHSLAATNDIFTREDADFPDAERGAAGGLGTRPSRRGARARRSART